MESELPQIIRLVLALAFVLALMGGLALLLKRFGLSTGMASSSGEKRLKVVEALPLDARHRAILLQRDDKQHLVILGPNSETVVENDIKPKKNNEKTENKNRA